MAIDIKPFELPKLKKYLQSDPKNTFTDAEAFWDVRFYPYDTDEDARPIFAISNKKTILVFRITDDATGDIEIIRTFEVESGEQSLDPFTACGWGYINQDEPLLLGAGDPGLIRVFDVVKGDLKTTLRGHGQGTINDLATHPRYPWIIASASIDTSIRIWDLRRWNSKNESPSVIICGHGHGHKQGLLSVAWHDSGRYLISGGHDHRVCIWTLPDLSPESSFWEEISPSQRKRTSDEIRVIHYPHFVSSALHPNFVDCVRFYGDCVLSKSAEQNHIALWQIAGFDTNNPPPDPVLAPKTQEHLETRNGFMRTLDILPNGVHRFGLKEELKQSPPFTRLLEFEVPACTPFFIRFELLEPSPRHPDIHPVLAIGNTSSQVFFWDLEALTLGYDGRASRGPRKIKADTPIRKPLLTDRGRKLQASTSSAGPTTSSPSSARSSSLHRSASTEPTPSSDLFPMYSDSLEPDRVRFPLDKPSVPIKRHAEILLKKKLSYESTITTRSVAFSNDGKWCVVAGETFDAIGGWGPNTKGGKREREKKQVGAAGILGRW